MTEYGEPANGNDRSTTHNENAPGGVVGVQAEQIHNSHIHIEQGEDRATKYANGVRCLHNGWRDLARTFIREAIGAGYDTAETQYHGLLALLSNRSLRELSAQDFHEIEKLDGCISEYPKDHWRDALAAVCTLVLGQRDATADAAAEMEALRNVSETQHDQIIDHLQHIIRGGLKDQVWSRLRERARDGRYDHGRHERLWTYFVPTPATPRAQLPDKTTTMEDRCVAIISALLFLASLGYVGHLVLTEQDTGGAIAYTVTLLAGITAFWSGAVWRYRTHRYATRDREFTREWLNPLTYQEGFAKDVYRCFRYYFLQKCPADTEYRVWMANTVGIRETLYREIVDIYRDQGTSAASVRWLIRFLVEDIVEDGVDGKRDELRERYRVPPALQGCCITAIAVFAIATLLVLVPAMHHLPGRALPATFVLLLCGQVAVARWLHIILEHRRVSEEKREQIRKLAARREEYWRWKQLLRDRCPSEPEVEHWLDCDKTMFLDDALQYYGLKWQDIIAHTVLMTRLPKKAQHGPCRRRARAQHGPWRYTDYDMRLFLVTADGVREAATQLDFNYGRMRGRERHHFRFDAVSSVYVEAKDDNTYWMKLTLMNGRPRKIDVVDREANQLTLEGDETSAELSQMNLEMTGFSHTLHILEGIAAEGKDWIARDAITRETSGPPVIESTSAV